MAPYDGNEFTMESLARMARESGWTGPVAPRSGRLTPIPWSELHNLPKREPLIRGLLDKSSLSVVFGESNCGKTFLALDMALHITMGTAWRGMKTSQGAVVYIAAEGGLGLENRLKAFRIHHKLESYPPFYLIPTSVDLCNADADTDELIDEIRKIPDVALIIVDTLSRAMAGGNENASEDMGAVINHGDRLKEELKTHVMFIHHSGKDSSKGARGHSALRAAVDTEIEVKKTPLGVLAEVTKQRDGETGVKYGFTLLPVPLSLGEGLVSSCVLTSNDEAAHEVKKLAQQPRKALEVLRYLLNEKSEPRVSMKEYRDALAKAGITASDKPDNVRRVISQLIIRMSNDGNIVISGEYVGLPDKPDKAG